MKSPYRINLNKKPSTNRDGPFNPFARFIMSNDNDEKETGLK